MAKKKIYAELAPFGSMVDAQARYLEKLDEAARTGSDERVESEIFWDSASVNGNFIQAQQVKVCDVPEYLQDLGFEGAFVYDRTHFERHMLPGDKTHGHDGTPEQMKMLPQVLQHPVAIITNSPDQSSPDWRPLTFIYADPADKDKLGNQIFKKAVVSPVELYGGTLECGTASKVVTYYDIDFRTFDAIMASTQPQKGYPPRQELLYFDKEMWDKLPAAVRGAIPETQKSVSREIDGHYSTPTNVNKQSQRHIATLQRAVHNELSRYAERSFDMFDTRHSPVVRAVEIVRSSNATPQDLMLARKIFEKSTELCRDKELAYKALGRFAQEHDSKMMELVKSAMESIRVQSEGDIDRLWELCDELKPLMMNPGQEWDNEIGDIVAAKSDQFYDLQLQPMQLDGFEVGDLDEKGPTDFSQCEDLCAYMEELDSVDLEFGDI